MSLQFSQDERSITIGASQVTLYSEDQAAVVAMGCLSRSQLTVGRSLRPIICNMLDGITGLRPLQPSASLAVNARELSSLNLAVAGGSTQSLLSGASLARQTQVGDPTAASSTLAVPAEWHIVKLSGAAPWTFSLYAENRDLWYASGNFVIATDVQAYNCAYTNGTADAPKIVGLSYDDTSAYTANSFFVDNAALGKFTFNTLADANIAQWTYDATAGPIVIQGITVIPEADVRHGDTVALIGLAYRWGSVPLATGAEASTAQRIKIQFDGGNPTPMGIKLVHEFEVARTRKLFIARIWKGVNMNGFGTGFDSQGGAEVTLDMMFTALNDVGNHPLSPFCEIELVDATADLGNQAIPDISA